MATGSRPRAGVDDVILVPVSPSHRRRTRVLLTVTALVAVIVALLLQRVTLLVSLVCVQRCQLGKP